MAIGMRVFVTGLPLFKDCNRAMGSTHPLYLHCLKCERGEFYRLEQMHGLPYGEPYQAVYVCRHCCTFHTVRKQLSYVEGGDDIETVDFETWTQLELIEESDDENL